MPEALTFQTSIHEVWRFVLYFMAVFGTMRRLRSRGTASSGSRRISLQRPWGGGNPAFQRDICCMNQKAGRKVVGENYEQTNL